MEFNQEQNSEIIKIIKYAQNIYDKLGYGYKEHIYSNAMCIELRNNQFQFQNEVICPIIYSGIQIGYERADIVVYEPINIVIEFKAQTTNLQKKEINQLKKYLQNFNIENGILINFGNTFECISVNNSN